ncbi:MAG: LuxR C-terminal-related transcriptional regulator, partial [Raoultibacter sp.]
QSFFPAEVLAIAGIMVAGAGYTWFTCVFCTLLAKTQCMSYAISSVIAGLALKTILVQLCTGILNESFQVGLAILLPLVICGLAFFGQKGPSTRRESDETKLATNNTAGYRYLVPQLVVAAIAVATTRVITPLGFFGDPLNLYENAISATLGTIGVDLVLVVLGYLTLVRRTNTHLNTRFMPAFLVIILTFFVSAFSPSYQGFLAAAAEIFITAAEALSHALFWTIAITTIRHTKASPFRVVGLSTGFYDLLSIIWIAAFFSLGIVNNAIILLVAFLLVSLIIWLIDRGGHEDEIAPPGMQTDRRVEIAEKYGLSPREKEVFMMLAQGRSRAYISEDLILSEGTIKTHISHIYTKLGVSNRQEMFDVLLEDDHKN